MCKARTKIVPGIVGGLGTMKKGLDQNLQLFSGHPSATELQKVTLMNTAHIVRKMLGKIALISCWDLELQKSTT